MKSSFYFTAFLIFSFTTFFVYSVDFLRGYYFTNYGFGAYRGNMLPSDFDFDFDDRVFLLGNVSFLCVTTLSAYFAMSVKAELAKWKFLGRIVLVSLCLLGLLTGIVLADYGRIRTSTFVDFFVCLAIATAIKFVLARLRFR